MNQKDRDNVYKQMTIIQNQIQSLLHLYDEWKNYLLNYPSEKTPPVSSSRISIESTYQNYMNQKKQPSLKIDYFSISLKIASILKENGVPMSSKAIFNELVKSGVSTLTYSNLTSNILRKMDSDKTVNVVRAYRGYWQYFRK